MTHRIRLAINDLLSKEDSFNDLVNIGGQAPLSMIELIQTIERTSNRKIVYKLEQADATDLLKTEANKIYGDSIFGKIPYTKLEDGIREFFNWANSPRISGQMSNWVMSVRN